jgi:hypothetical protein
VYGTEKQKPIREAWIRVGLLMKRVIMLHNTDGYRRSLCWKLVFFFFEGIALVLVVVLVSCSVGVDVDVDTDSGVVFVFVFVISIVAG